MFFLSPYTQYQHFNGAECVITRAMDPESYDCKDVGPMYMIRFINGEEIQAFPEELILNRSISHPT